MIFFSYLLYGLLALPVLLSFYYSLEKDFAWTALALAALALAVAFIHAVALRIDRRAPRLAWMLLTSAALAALQTARLVSFYFQGESFNERFFFHFNPASVTEAGAAYLPLMAGAALLLLAVAAAAAAAALAGPPARRNTRRAGWWACAPLLVLALLDPDVLRFQQHLYRGIMHASAAPSLDTIAWRELGLDRAALAGSSAAPEAGRNLVFVYLESLESIYTDESLFPGLTPHLNRLAEQGLRFSGIRQTPGTEWTVGGMLASQCGTPLLYQPGPGGNDILQNGFLNDAECLGDVLEAAGYRQVFLGGASRDFAGKGDFLAAHGYDEVKGRAELAGELDDPAYLSGWGLYDDSLFSLAARTFFELAEGEQPFNLTLLTLDNHHPEGDASRSCPPYEEIDNSILHAVHCTDFLLNRFLEEIRGHEAWRNTVVVLFSDHLAMRNAAQRYYPAGYDRRLLFQALNAGSGEIPRAGTHMDVAPTVLELLGVRHGRRFLAGENLLGVSRTPPSAEYFSRPERLDALRFLNSRMLTGSAAGLCENEWPVTGEKERLLISGREVAMSIAGDPVAPRSLESGHALLALLSPGGALRSTQIVRAENLAHVLYQFKEDLFLLVAPTTALPAMLEAEGEDRLAVLLGSLQGKVAYVDGADSLEALRVGREACRGALEEVAAGGRREGLLAEICPAPASGTARIEGEVMHLPVVATESEWLEARLEGSPAAGYRVVERRTINPPAPLAGTEHCHAYYGNAELIVPSVDIEGRRGAMKLRQVPEGDLEFEVVEML